MTLYDHTFFVRSIFQTNDVLEYDYDPYNQKRVTNRNIWPSSCQMCIVGPSIFRHKEQNQQDESYQKWVDMLSGNAFMGCLFASYLKFIRFNFEAFI